MARDMKSKRKACEDYIVKVVEAIDPGGLNTERYKKHFAAMNDDEFHTFMEELKDHKKRKLTIYAPNMKNNLRMNNVVAAADLVGVKLFERIRLWDGVNKRYYLTPEKYLVLKGPWRRLKQHLKDKMSVPESDTTIDLLTGQVVKPDKGSSVSSTEAQTYASKGLTKSLTELINVRGGNIGAYAAFKASLEETGVASLGEIDATSRVRSAVVAGIYLKAMMLDNNL